MRGGHGVHEGQGAQGVPGPKTLSLPFTQRRCAKEQRLIIEGQTQIDETLVHNIALARELYAFTTTGMSLKAAAEQLSLTTDAVKKLLPLAYLSPRLVERAVKGQLPSRATSKWIKQTPLRNDQNTAARQGR